MGMKRIMSMLISPNKATVLMCYNVIDERIFSPASALDNIGGQMW